jgi:hypothetical protein
MASNGSVVLPKGGEEYYGLDRDATETARCVVTFIYKFNVAEKLFFLGTQTQCATLCHYEKHRIPHLPIYTYYESKSLYCGLW